MATTTKIAINGFGRIGRCVARVLLRARARRDLELVAINDLTDADDARAPARSSTRCTAASTSDGRGRGRRRSSIGGKQHPDPRREGSRPSCPWKDLGVDIVLECTGLFTDKAKAAAHLDGGRQEGHHQRARRERHRRHVLRRHQPRRATTRPSTTSISNASCTTNCLAPVAKVLHETLRHREGPHDDDPLVHERPAAPRPAAQGPAPRARRRAVDDPDARTGAAKALGLVLPGAQGQARRHGDPRADAERLARRPDRAGRRRRPTRDEVNDALQGGRRRPAQGHPRRSRRAARLERLHRRPALVDRRRRR